MKGNYTDNPRVLAGDEGEHHPQMKGNYTTMGR